MNYFILSKNRNHGSDRILFWFTKNYYFNLDKLDKFEIFKYVAVIHSREKAEFNIQEVFNKMINLKDEEFFIATEEEINEILLMKNIIE